MPNNKRRVLILSEIISPYRIPVFNALARHEGLDLHVVFLSETDAGLRQWRVYKDEIRFSYEVLPSARFRAGRDSLLLNWKLRVVFEEVRARSHYLRRLQLCCFMGSALVGEEVTGPN